MRAVHLLKSTARNAGKMKPMQMKLRYSPHLVSTRLIHVNTISVQDQRAIKEQMVIHRPLSPYLTYKLPFGALASVANRATGFGLVLGWTTVGLLSLPGLPVTVLPMFIEAIKTVPVVHGLVKAAVSFSFGYHSTKSVCVARAQRLDADCINRIGAAAIATGFICSGVAVFLL